MARVTARQAHTRSRTRRLRTKAEQQQAILEARARFVRQLSTVRIEAQVDNMPRAGVSKRREPADASCKKITEYFSTITSLDFMTRQKKNSLRTSISFDRDGHELITIHDSDAENDDNNNADSVPVAPSPRQNSISDDNRSVNSSTSDNSSTSTPLRDIDIKPGRQLALNHGDTSFMDLKINVRLDDDIEIVEMLPPIPLRDHPIHEIDDI